MPLFNLAFRPFFIYASIYAVISIFTWLAVYINIFSLSNNYISNFQWHAHEMIYGYSVAVIAGFIMTAIRTWTGVQTIYGLKLLAFSSLWIVARILFFLNFTLWAAFFDLLFLLILIICATLPIVKAKKWQQLAIVSKIFFFFIGNLLFYLGVFGIVKNGIHLGIYGGVYLIIGLILTIARRVLPFFIELGVENKVTLYNSKFIDIASLIFFILFFIFELGQFNNKISAYIAILLFIINGIRLCYWYNHGIWKRPLLWSLYFGMWFICLGFLLYFLAVFYDISKFVVIHAFTYGGIGLMTLSMMARISLGHTGRNVHKPPKAITIAFVFLILGFLFRVLFPMITNSYYLYWIIISQIFWIGAFLIFIYLYSPILVKNRVDNKFG